MKIVVVGVGYVGLVSGACFAEKGHTVTCVDIDKDKIEKLNKGIVSIYEPSLDLMVQRNIEKGHLHFTTNTKRALVDAEVVFIAVGTPMGKDGAADLQYVFSVAKGIGQNMTNDLVVVNKSTVPVGTADKVKEIVQQELFFRSVDFQCYLVSNPEFLKEGDAIRDCMNPDRIVVGVEKEFAFQRMKELYRSFFQREEQFIKMDIRSAEMTKYAANAMLATKISFINEIANICERLGADVDHVRMGIGSDSRIGYSFINPGCGYGGSCFPKDVKALKKIAEDVDYKAELITAVERVNDKQKVVIVDKVKGKYGDDLTGKIFAIWGLSFKPETDDMREAPSIYVINELVKCGASIQVYDPKAMVEAKDCYLKGLCNVFYYENKYDALRNAEALIILTEWKEFVCPDFVNISALLKDKVVFDGRNLYIDYGLENEGFEYIRIGK